ncbi:MAG: DUF1730 domain-containing protein [Acidipila sp.]|nr:DUF1730 domain-containing protein [Acidipila sp.]
MAGERFCRRDALSCRPAAAVSRTGAGGRAQPDCLCVELQHTSALFHGSAQFHRTIFSTCRVAPPLAPPIAVAQAFTEGGASPAPTADDRAHGGDVEPLSSLAPRGWISRYAWGEDYHAVLGEKLRVLVGAMHEQFVEPFDARAYVDTGPLVERLAARYAGLGWLGKNTCLIHPQLGSWLFLGVIVTTLDLAPTLASRFITQLGATEASGMASTDNSASTASTDNSTDTATEGPSPDLCGNCTLCIEACPTGALVEPYLLDARRCISYLTIEHRGTLPLEMREAMGRHVFGCDICQDVCPWNGKAPGSAPVAFLPREALFAPELEWLAAMNQEEYQAKFRNSPVKRAKWSGLVRNACVALGNAAGGLGPAARERVGALLARLASSEDAVIAEHAGWALRKLAKIASEQHPAAS